MYGLERSDVHSPNKNYEEVLKRVSLNRCDIGLVGVDVVLGISRIENWKVPKNVILEPLQQIKPISFHLWISKGSSRALDLTVRVNQAIIDLQHDGTADRIFAKYTGPPY